MNDSGQKGSYRRARVLLTGASGFIGRWVARLLTQEDAHLWIVDKDKERLARVSEAYSIQGTHMTVDLGKPNSFQGLFREIQPDITFNLAGYGVLPSEKDESLAWKINVELVEEMALTIAQESNSEWRGSKFIHVGSGFEYGSFSDKITESTEPKPKTIYGRSKLAGTKNVQEVCKTTGLRAVTARLFTVYGPGEHPERLLPSIIQAAKSDELLKLTKGKQKRDFTYVEDVAMGLLKLGLVHNVPGCVVNLATGKLTSVRDFVECAKALCGIDSSRLLYGAIPNRENEVWQGNVDVSLLRHLVGWVPRCSIREGIKGTIEFEKPMRVKKGISDDARI